MTIIFAMHNKVTKEMQVTHGAVLPNAHVHLLSLAFHSLHLNFSLLFCHLQHIPVYIIALSQRSDTF